MLMRIKNRVDAAVVGVALARSRQHCASSLHKMQLASCA